jgi:hypothetical protein
MPKKITRIESAPETNGDASSSFVAFIGGSPQLIKYENGFVGEDENLDGPIEDIVSKMDGAELRDLTEAEERAILENPSMSFEQKVNLIQNHEERVIKQLDRIIDIHTYARGVEDGE